MVQECWNLTKTRVRTNKNMPCAQMLYIWIASFIHACLVDRNLQTCADSERGTGVQTRPPPLKKSQKGSLSNTSLDPQKNHIASIQYWPRETHFMAFRWWADDGPHIVALDTFSSSPVMNKNNNKKVVIHVVGPLWQSCLDPRMTNISLVDRNYKYQQLFPTEEVHYFLTIDADISLHFSHRRRYFFTFLAF